MEMNQLSDLSGNRKEFFEEIFNKRFSVKDQELNNVDYN